MRSINVLINLDLQESGAKIKHLSRSPMELFSFLRLKCVIFRYYLSKYLEKAYFVFSI